MLRSVCRGRLHPQCSEYRSPAPVRIRHSPLRLASFNCENSVFDAGVDVARRHTLSRIGLSESFANLFSKRFPGFEQSQAFDEHFSFVQETSLGHHSLYKRQQLARYFDWHLLFRTRSMPIQLIFHLNCRAEKRSGHDSSTNAKSRRTMPFSGARHAPFTFGNHHSRARRWPPLSGKFKG